jgi:hypothetical protein
VAKRYRIAINMVKCLQCKQVLLSLHRHDFRMCKCPNSTFVDGGTAYVRTGGMDSSQIEFRTLYLDKLSGTIGEVADMQPEHFKEELP